MIDWSGQAIADSPAVELGWEGIEGGQGPAGPINASCLVLSPTQGIAITPQTMLGSGGAGGPYTFIASGLPSGLTMSSGGTLSGTPTVSGTFPYSVLIIDSAAGTGGVGCSLTVAPAAASASATLAGRAA